MNTSDQRGSDIDSDRAEGSLKQAAGHAKESVGGLVGDEKLKREGQADRAEGKAQNAWGGVKDKAREAFGSDRARENGQ